MSSGLEEVLSLLSLSKKKLTPSTEEKEKEKTKTNKKTGHLGEEEGEREGTQTPNYRVFPN